jgi:hypothetical protein
VPQGVTVPPPRRSTPVRLAVVAPTTVPTTQPSVPPTPTPTPVVLAQPVHRVSAAEVDPVVQATQSDPLDNPVVVLTLVVVVVAAGVAGTKASSGR